MISCEVRIFKHNKREANKDYQGYDFLHDFQLYKRKRTAIAGKPHTVCRHL